MRAWLRTAAFGIPTVLGLAKRGFFIPYRYAGELPNSGATRSYGAVEERFHHRASDFLELLDGLADYRGDLVRIGSGPAPAPRWTQTWFPRLDAAIAYGLLRRHAPRQVIEVGSGHSTRFLCQAVADGDLATDILAIDPAPRAMLAASEVGLIRQPLHRVGCQPFSRLSEGDFLMVDSSHILMPGSDVDFLLGHVLPALPVGVMVQFHDIFLPDDYPGLWHWRGYNEQQGVLPLILGQDWEVVFSSYYLVTRYAERVAASVLREVPMPQGALESALWLRKLAG